MYCINFRIGILFKQNKDKHSYELRYFFIDDEANLFHIPSLARLQKIIRLSSDFKQIRQKLIKFGQKSFSLKKYLVSNVQGYSTIAVIPFSNRTCFQIKLAPKQGEKQPIKQAKQGNKSAQNREQSKGYKIFGFLDEDTPLLRQQILVLTGKKKVQTVKRKSIIEDEKNKLDKKLNQFFDVYVKNQEKFKMSNFSQQNEEISFVSLSQEGKPEGKCSQTLLAKDISFTYTGEFYHGKKHGQGLLVSSNLDSLSCEFINDQIAGI